MGKLRKFFKKKLIRKFVYRLPIVITCFCFMFSSLSFSVSAAGPTPLFTTQFGVNNNIGWYIERSEPFLSSNLIILDSNRRYYGVHITNNFVQVESNNFLSTLKEGFEYVLTFTLYFGGASERYNSVDLYVQVQNSSGAYKKSKSTLSFPNGYHTKTLHTVRFIAPASNNNWSIFFEINVKPVSTGWNEVYFIDNLNLYYWDEYNDHFNNPRSGAANSMDNTASKLTGAEEAALGGQTADDIGGTIDGLLDPDGLNDFITTNDLSSIQWFFGRIFNAFGDYKFVLIFSCTIGLIMFILGRGPRMVAISNMRKAKKMKSGKKGKGG